MYSAEDILKRFDEISSNRSEFEAAWDDCRTYVLPYSPPIYGGDNTQGTKDVVNYDDTAEIANRNLSSVLMSSTTNPSVKWVMLESDDEMINKEDSDARAYFEAVGSIIMKEIENSNAYIKIHEYLKNLSGYGTAYLFVERGKINTLNFRTFYISECYISENSEGRVDTLYRVYELSARAAAQEFGEEALSEETKRKLRDRPEEKVSLLHAVFPRENIELDGKGQPKKNTKNMPFASIVIEKETKHVLRESGFRMFPFAISRWDKESGQDYGHGPAMDALPSIRVINNMERDRLHLAEKIANPPVGVIGDDPESIDMTPGGKTSLDADTKIIWLVTGANFPITEEAIQEKKKAINDAFFVNQLYNINMIDKDMTATEVNARMKENLRILGPVFSRMQNEFIEPMLSRCIDILNEDGKLPPPPRSLAGKEFRFRYISPLARAQKEDELRAVSGATNACIALEANSGRPITDNIDLDKAARYIVEHSGVPADIMRDPAIVVKIREGRQQEQVRNAQIQEQILATQMRVEDAKAEDRFASAELKRRREK